MKVSGKGLITVIQPLIMKQALAAKRAGKAKEPPARGAVSRPGGAHH